MREPAANEANSRCFAPLRMTVYFRLLLLLAGIGVWLLPILSCSQAPDPNTLVMIIESSPTNLDPRVGIDAQSERIGELLFDALLTRDEHLNVQPGLADRWDIPDPLTYIFHLHRGVTFHDGRPLTSRDVKWTLDSVLEGKIRSTKSAAYRFIDRIEAPDDFTVVFHLKEPNSTLLWNLSEGASGIVPYGSLDEITRQPIGSGPFKFVSAEQDKEIIIARNDNYWGTEPRLSRIRFTIVPDATTRALELRKGSADAAINALTSDTVVALERESNLQIDRAPGTVLSYLAFNLRDPTLRDVHVRQAIAYAVDRGPLLQYIWRGFAQPAQSILPRQSWAYDQNVAFYPHDPEKARQILDAAGYPAHDGIRFHLTIKTSSNCAKSVSRSTFAPLSSPPFLPTSPAAPFSFIPYAGSEEMKIPIFLNTPSTPTDSLPKAQTGASIPIRASTASSTGHAARSIKILARSCTTKFRKSWRRMFPTSTSGTSTTCWYTRDACTMPG